MLKVSCGQGISKDFWGRCRGPTDWHPKVAKTTATDGPVGIGWFAMFHKRRQGEVMDGSKVTGPLEAAPSLPGTLTNLTKTLFQQCPNRPLIKEVDW